MLTILAQSYVEDTDGFRLIIGTKPKRSTRLNWPYSTDYSSSEMLWKTCASERIKSQRLVQGKSAVTNSNGGL